MNDTIKVQKHEVTKLRAYCDSCDVKIDMTYYDKERNKCLVDVSGSFEDISRVKDMMLMKEVDPPVPPEIKLKEDDKMVTHGDICAELTRLYTAKNQDYGDSFHKSYLKYGMTMSLIRLEDKLNRIEQLATCMSSTPAVENESVRDTLMDLANYAIMTVMEMDNAKE